MSHSVQQWHNSFVLHTRPYSNTSLIVEALSQDQGRVSLLAKGARNAKSKYYSILQPFIPLRLRWSGRSELHTLIEAEAAGPSALPAHRVFTGFYLNELLLRLLHKHDAHPGLLEFYAETLEALTECDNVEPPLRYFEVQLLNEIGYGLELEYETGSGEPIDSAAWYDYQAERGPVRIAAREQGRLSVTGSTLLGLKSRSLDSEDQLREAKQLLRTLLGEYLGAKPLESRRLFL